MARNKHATTFFEGFELNQLEVGNDCRWEDGDPAVFAI